jgi:hypothetical protein
MESIGADGKLRPFEHPFVQACSMFLGEILCLLTFKALYFHFKRKNVRIVRVLSQFELAVENPRSDYIQNSERNLPEFF